MVRLTTSLAVIFITLGAGIAPSGTVIASDSPAGNSAATKSAPVEAACPECEPLAGGPDLFANYYVPPVCGGMGGQLYVAPGAVPPFVGHTYITYQPLMPHELLYPHYHSYYRYYDGGRGMTRAKTVYYYPPIRTWAGHIVHHLRIPR